MLDTPRTTLVAAMRARHARHLGALRRLAPVRRARRRAAHAHPRPLVPGAAADAGGRSAWTAINRNILFTCLGSPDQAGVRRDRPGAAAAGRQDPAVLRRPVGQPRATPTSCATWRPSRSPKPCPTWSRARCATAASTCDNVTVIALEWETPGHLRVHPRHLHRQHQRRRVRLDHPGRRARHAGRRPRRRGHRALDRRDQRGDPALRGQEGLSADPGAGGQGSPVPALPSLAHNRAPREPQPQPFR